MVKRKTEHGLRFCYDDLYPVAQSSGYIYLGLQFVVSLLGADGVLVRLYRCEPQDTDVLCCAVQCVANILLRLALCSVIIVNTTDLLSLR